MKYFFKIYILPFILSCGIFAEDNLPFAVVLGIAQDGGAPHAGCTKTCCSDRWENLENQYRVSCLGIVSPQKKYVWMIDSTPDFPEQFYDLTQNGTYQLKGIFLTHAHIGHYTGLIHLGREVMGAKKISVHTMPRMRSYLENNGPWNQLVFLKQITLQPMSNQKMIRVSEQISVTPFLVPHRDEYSETVGFQVSGPNKKLIFIPDIDKWDKWETNIIDIIQQNDYILIDGTFFGQNEIPNRNMMEIPHPFIVESLERFSVLSDEDKSKIFFIHLNHTNPALNSKSEQRKNVINSGFNISFRGKRFPL